MTTSPEPTGTTLYEALGGEPGMLRLAAAHHARCVDDPLLEHPFSHGTRDDHVERLAAYWTEVFGGPPVFSTTCSTEAVVRRTHAETSGYDDLGRAFEACFAGALDDVGVTEPALRQALADYMAWAVGQVLALAPDGSGVPDDLPVPRWSWDGLVATRARSTA